MKTISTFLCVAIVLGNLAFVNSDDLPPSYKPSIHQVMVKAAIYYNIKPESLMAVAKCESSMSATALGDHGKAKGILQFHQSTFDSYAKRISIDNPDIWNVEQQSQVASYMWSIGQQRQWSCWTILHKKGKL